MSTSATLKMVNVRFVASSPYRTVTRTARRDRTGRADLAGLARPGIGRNGEDVVEHGPLERCPTGRRSTWLEGRGRRSVIGPGPLRVTGPFDLIRKLRPAA